MTKHFSIFFGITLLFITDTVEAAEKYAGQWHMTSMILEVRVESWGSHCGPQPSSYASKKSQPVKIVESGQHLIFSRGGLRTDRCGSPNPRLYTISKKSSPGRWKRVCQTAKNDPKFEKGEYSLVAPRKNELNYIAISSFDWTLKGDHCIARSIEKRVYTRNSAKKKRTSSPKVTQDQVNNGKKSPTIEVSDPWDICEESGPVKKLRVLPRRTKLGPSGTVCLKAFASYANDCKKPVKAQWTVTQDKYVVNGLISKTGCFHAGDTAADAEGRYVVTANAKGRSNSAEVLVVFPDLDELLTARLRPPKDTSEADKRNTEPSSPQPVDRPNTPLTSPVVPNVPKQLPTNQTTTSQFSSGLIFTFLIVALTGIVLFILIIRGYLRRRTVENQDFENWPDPLSVSTSTGSNAPSSSGKSLDPKADCPTCGTASPENALFCPVDGTKLSPEKSKGDLKQPKHQKKIGMICPKCHRGYDPGSRFCPHDSNRLEPYPAWRERRRS